MIFIYDTDHVSVVMLFVVMHWSLFPFQYYLKGESP